MNFKTTYALFGAFLVILVIAGVWLLSGSKPGTENLLFPVAKAQKITAKDIDIVTIEVKKPKETKLVFKRIDDKRWRMVEPTDVSADGSAVDRIVDDLLSARREGKSDLPKNLSDLGLDKPSMIVTLGRKAGQSYFVSLGDVTLGGTNAQVFALAGDRPKDPIPLRRGSLSSLLKSEGNEATDAGSLAKSAVDFRSKELLLEGAGFNPADSVTAFSISDGKSTVALSKQPDGTWKYDKPENYGPAETRGEPSTSTTTEIVAPTGVEPLLTAAMEIKPATSDDVVDAATDLAQYGVDPEKPDGFKVEVTRKGDDKETLLVGKKDDATGKYFARLAGEKSIAKVAGNKIDPLKKLLVQPGALRDKQLLTFTPSSGDGIDIKLPGDSQPFEIRKVGSPPTWKIFESDGSSQLANTRNITELLTALGGKTVKDFPEPNATDAALGFDHPAAEVTLYVGGVIPDEKKDESKADTKDKDKKKDEPKDKDKESKDKDKSAEQPKDKSVETPKPAKPKMKDPAAQLIFGKRDKDLFFVRRIVKDKDGKETKSDFAVSETLWPKVTRGRMEYVDPTLPSFITTAANKLAFWRGQEAFLIESQEKATGWVIRQPADRSDRLADPAVVDSILQELSTLNAVRLWSEKPSEKEMERYGLKSPRFKAIVTLKDGDKSTDKDYIFGSETDDKTGIYAKMSERDIVFVVSKLAIPTLESGEIQDSVVFRLDANRVNSIRLTGWKDVLGQPTTRELERKGTGNWSLKGDDKIKLSTGQCESFLNALTLVRADKFVVHKAGPKDEYKLNVAQGALEIEIRAEGEKDPITLMIGAPVQPDNKHYYAMSNKLPGDVFLLPKGIFEAVKAKPGFFAAE